MKRVEIVFNPNSGRGKAPLLAADIARLLDRQGVVATRVTLAQFFASPLTADVGCICALGGDGTIRAIVERYAGSLRGEAPPIAVVALGTANLISKHLALPWSADAGMDRLVDSVLAGTTRAMDIPVANGKPFLVVCSTGFDARVVHELAARRSGPITRLNYLPAVARSLIDFDENLVEVIADGKRLFGPEPAMVVVANAPEYGTGFSLSPAASSNDGLLNLSIFRLSERLHVLTSAASAITGQIAKTAALMTIAKTIEIRGNSHAQIDGEAFGKTPITISLLPYQQRFIVGNS